jgi:hypothetical protein
MTQVPDWREIIGTSADAGRLATAALRDARWLSQVMKAADRDHEVGRAPSWGDAVASLNRTDQVDGVFDPPARQILTILDAEPSQETATAADAAARRALTTLDWHPAIPAHLTVPELVAVSDAITGFVRFLFLEIYAARLATDRPCTYFRDQLGWFLAGFLPCGWDGEWPTGRMVIL